ncbi:AfsR/SARP family transcriptional regulator [Streptosporangium subroseum]|uniref:AfsR/SARP family transcriptional regulator n=1 Tax=Streptosporangium subroseum TaxID=106412 RepID=UPI0030934FA7|nr:winged helix-turn-helix domain-containing protein [Streptosporangium subroseum]
MRFGVLGPVEVVADNGPVSIAQPRHRAFLAYLLLNANRVVTPDQVIEAMWGGAEPTSARSQIHVAVSVLRRALREQGLNGVIVTTPGGYRLTLAGDELDADIFDRHVEAARVSTKGGDHEESVRRLRAALRLWRGQALADIAAAYAQPARQQLHERRLVAQELLIDAELTLGHHDTLIPELGRLVEEHPLRERLTCQLMLAQHRAGLHTDALQTARRMRDLLAEELGLDPGAQFSELEKAILNADPALNLDVGAATAPTSSTKTTPAQLPFDVQGFSGRERELRELTRIADASGRPPAVLVIGTAGVGKTALAVHWAHRNRDRFPDGQLYVNLRGFDADRAPMEPSDALRRFLRSLGVDSAAIPEDVDEAAALFRSHLSRRRVLIVLDNARSADQLRPLLPGSASCAVLVTSRNQLRGLVIHEGACLLQLDPLTEAEANDLLYGALADRADGSGDGGDTAVGQLARQCAYLPLALRLAAAQLAYHRHLTVADYARELTVGDALSILDESSDLNGVVGSTFGLSYRALTPAAQRLFRLLSLPPGQDFTPVVAAALLGVTLVEARRPLEELCTVHLISEHRPGRYVMHDLLRSYATTTFVNNEPEPDRKAATRRLVDFYAETVFEAYSLLQPRRVEGARDVVYPPLEPLRFTDRASALAWHDQERENLAGVIDIAAKHAWHRCAWQLTNDLFAYFIIRRRWPDWLAALRIGGFSAERSGDLEAMAYMENAMGVVHKQIGKYDAARAHYGRAIELAAAAGRSRMVASFNVNIGGLYINEGDLEAGVRHLQTALAIPEYGQNPQYAATAYVNLGCALIEMEKYADAAEVLHRALEFAGIVNDVQQACYSHHNLAEIALRQGDRDTSRQHAERQLQLSQEIGDPLRTAGALDSLASALAQDDLAAARTHWGAAHKIYQDLDHRLATVLEEWLRTLDVTSDPAELAAADETRRRLCRRLI